MDRSVACQLQPQPAPASRPIRLRLGTITTRAWARPGPGRIWCLRRPSLSSQQQGPAGERTSSRGPALDLPRISRSLPAGMGVPPLRHPLVGCALPAALYVNSSGSRRSVPDELSLQAFCVLKRHHPSRSSSSTYSHGHNGCLAARSSVAAPVQSSYADVSNGCTHYGAFHRRSNH